MAQPTKYRRISDGSIVDALQYGASQTWDNEELTKVRDFVTGVDTTNYTGIANERMLDVVQPILSRWDSAAGQIPIQVSDTKTGVSFEIGLGDWLVRLQNGALLAVHGDAFPDSFEPVKEFTPGQYKSHKELEIEELARFLYRDAFADLEMDFPEGMAHLIAPKIINAGWRKEQ